MAEEWVEENIDKARELARMGLCDHCIGRQFAKLGERLTDEERGRMLRAALEEKGEHYALVHDESLTWKQLARSIFSSDSRDHISFRTVASDYYNDSPTPEGSYIPAAEEEKWWFPLEGFEAGEASFVMASLEGDEARKVFPAEASGGARSLIAYRQGERILWRKGLSGDRDKRITNNEK